MPGYDLARHHRGLSVCPTRDHGILLKVARASTTKASTNVRGPRAIYNAKDIWEEGRFIIITIRAKVPGACQALSANAGLVKKEKASFRAFDEWSEAQGAYLFFCVAWSEWRLCCTHTHFFGG